MIPGTTASVLQVRKFLSSLPEGPLQTSPLFHKSVCVCVMCVCMCIRVYVLCVCICVCGLALALLQQKRLNPDELKFVSMVFAPAAAFVRLLFNDGCIIWRVWCVTQPVLLSVIHLLLVPLFSAACGGGLC